MQWCVLLPVVLTLIATQDNNGGSMELLANLCYTKWALQAFVISNAERLNFIPSGLHSSINPSSPSLIACMNTFRYSGVWLITRCGALKHSEYHIGDWGLCIIILFIYGILFRFLAFFCMITFKKK